MDALSPWTIRRFVYKFCQLETICVLGSWRISCGTFLCTLCNPLAPWSIRCKTLPNSVCHPYQILFLYLFLVSLMYQLASLPWQPGSMQTSSRDLTRSQGDLVRGSLENADPATVRRRVGGKRTIPTAPLALYLITVDSVSVLDSTPEAGMPEALEPSECDTKKRRVESFDESVDCFHVAWLTNSSE